MAKGCELNNLPIRGADFSQLCPPLFVNVFKLGEFQKRNCLYEETEIEKYQAVISPSSPLATMNDSEIDTALVKISREIIRIFQTK